MQHSRPKARPRAPSMQPQQSRAHLARSRAKEPSESGLRGMTNLLHWLCLHLAQLLMTATALGRSSQEEQKIHQKAESGCAAICARSARSATAATAAQTEPSRAASGGASPRPQPEKRPWQLLRQQPRPAPVRCAAGGTTAAAAQTGLAGPASNARSRTLPLLRQRALQRPARRLLLRIQSSSRLSQQLTQTPARQQRVPRESRCP